MDQHLINERNNLGSDFNNRKNDYNSKVVKNGQ